MKDYVVLPRGQDNCLPPRPLIPYFATTHDRFGRSQLHTSGQLTHTRYSDGDPKPDVLRTVRSKILVIHVHQTNAKEKNNLWGLNQNSEVNIRKRFLRGVETAESCLLN